MRVSFIIRNIPQERLCGEKIETKFSLESIQTIGIGQLHTMSISYLRNGMHIKDLVSFIQQQTQKIVILHYNLDRIDLVDPEMDKLKEYFDQQRSQLNLNIKPNMVHCHDGKTIVISYDNNLWEFVSAHHLVWQLFSE